MQESKGGAGPGNRDKWETLDFRGQFLNSPSLVEASTVVIKVLINKSQKSLPALQNGDVDVCEPIQPYGVDSLLAVELRNWTAKEFRAHVAVFETQGHSDQIGERQVGLETSIDQLLYSLWGYLAYDKKIP